MSRNKPVVTETFLGLLAAGVLLALAVLGARRSVCCLSSLEFLTATCSLCSAQSLYVESAESPIEFESCGFEAQLQEPPGSAHGHCGDGQAG